MPAYTASQAGYVNGGVYIDGAIVVAVTNAPNNWLGIQLTMNLNYDPTHGVPLAPTGFSAITINLTTVRLPAAFDAGTLTPYMVPEYTPAPYSNILLPGTRNEIACGTALAVAAGGGAGVIHTVTLDPAVMTPYIGHSTWRGVVSISLEWTNQVGVAGRVWSNAAPDTAYFDTTEYGYNTGFQGNYRGRRARAVHDFKSGLPYMTDEAVPDGYLEGVMVHPDSWDPIDPDPTYVPPPGEGLADDEVSSLE